MSVLSDKQILNGMKKGTVSITPFIMSHLNNSSFDVTLGDNYYRPHPEEVGEFFCPYNPDHSRKFWGEPLKAIHVTKEEDASLYGCKVNDRIIIINPRDTILGHTNEFIGGRENVTTMMQARSSVGRSCISVCKCAGWGDVGYINRWTMEIENASNSKAVLIVGERISQIVFMETGDTSRSYESKGSYQCSGDINELIKKWEPSMMLPRLKRDD